MTNAQRAEARREIAERLRTMPQRWMDKFSETAGSLCGWKFHGDTEYFREDIVSLTRMLLPNQRDDDDGGK